MGGTRSPTAPVAGGSAGTGSWGRALVGAVEILTADGPPEVGASAEHDTTDELADAPALSQNSSGAHFVEVRVSSVTGELRVPRMLGVFAGGRILNPRLARSQFFGAIGLGMALGVEQVLDPHTGDYVNHHLAEYHVPVHVDIGEMDVVWIDDPDDTLNPMASKGVGEIRIVGTAAAIANAVWHATGVRVRDLPIRLDRLLAGAMTEHDER